MANLTKQNIHKLPAIIALLTGATIWGIVWYPYRLAEQVGINGAVATTFTNAVALMIGLFLFRNKIQFSAIFNGQAHLLIWIGILSGCANIAYVLGIIAGEIMRVLLLFYLAPLWTIIFARFILKERLTLQGYFVVALAFFGAMTILWQPDNNLPLPASFGDWMGLLGGFLFALVNVLVRNNQGHSIQLKSVAIWLGTVMAGFGCSLIINVFPVLTEISINIWAILLGVGLLMLISSIAMQYGLTRTPANQAIVILLFELVVAAIAVYLLTNEAMTPLEWIGGFMIISATFFSAKMNHA